MTFDIHTHVLPVRIVADALERTRELLAAWRLPATFFVAAESAEGLVPQIRALAAAGHAIGCHGLRHTPDEAYDMLPPAQQATWLGEATRRLAEVSQAPVQVFRAPVFKVSGTTMQVLEDLGYLADCSIPAQRLGLLGSDPGNVRALFAPRQPYHPDPLDAYRPGQLRLWEIPVSAIGAPFTTSVLQVFGLGAARLMFALLRREARCTGKPIVYVAHPEDLDPAAGLPPRQRSWHDLWPSQTYGWTLRFWFYEQDGKVISARSRMLIQRMGGDAMRWMTLPAFVSTLSEQPAMRARTAALAGAP